MLEGLQMGQYILITVTMSHTLPLNSPAFGPKISFAPTIVPLHRRLPR